MMILVINLIFFSLGTVTVFVINRIQNGPKSVEVFDYNHEKNLLTLKKSIKDDNIYA